MTESRHYAHDDDFYTVCGYWADAVNTTRDLSKVTCLRCLAKRQADRNP